MKIRPLHDRVLVKRLDPQEETSSGGIIIPDTAKEKPMEAKIVALGTGKITEDGKKIEFVVKENDIVLLGKYSGTEVKVDGQEYLIIKEEDILAVVV